MIECAYYTYKYYYTTYLNVIWIDVFDRLLTTLGTWVVRYFCTNHSADPLYLSTGGQHRRITHQFNSRQLLIYYIHMIYTLLTTK